MASFWLTLLHFKIFVRRIRRRRRRHHLRLLCCILFGGCIVSRLAGSSSSSSSYSLEHFSFAVRCFVGLYDLMCVIAISYCYLCLVIFLYILKIKPHIIHIEE